jgi:hypothetical protein
MKKKRLCWRDFKYNSNKKPAGSGQRPLGNWADFIGSQGPERTATLEIKQKNNNFTLSVITYPQNWQGELNVTITHVPSVGTATVSSMSHLCIIGQSCHGELNVTFTYHRSKLPRWAQCHSYIYVRTATVLSLLRFLYKTPRHSPNWQYCSRISERT